MLGFFFSFFKGLFLKAAEMKDTGSLLHFKAKDRAAVKVRYHKSCYCQYTRYFNKPTATVTGTTEEEM